jgi:SIR2-like domain
MPNVPEPLIDDIAEGRCLPFFGAGFSLNARLAQGQTMPTWSGLTTALAQAGEIAARDSGPDVAQEYERKFGRVGLIDAIRRALHTDSVRPGAAHLAFAELPFDTVYTTNFDLLLEDALHTVRRPFRSLVGELQLPFHAGFLATNVVKLHGDLRHEEHIIVTRNDYDEFLDEYPVIATHLSAMLITRTALFVGYSRTDPDFQHILQVVRSRLGRFQRMSYIVQFGASDEELAESLGEQLHTISLEVPQESTRDDVLAAMFHSIQLSLDKRAGSTLRERRPDAFEEIESLVVEKAFDKPDPIPILEGSSHLCFVMMPFGDPFDTTYYEAIVPAVSATGLRVARADELARPGMIVEQIRTAIQQARVCVADITGSNPNVMYEVGMAQSIGKPIVLISQHAPEIPFDIAAFRVIIYDLDHLENLNSSLRDYLLTYLEAGKEEQAARLIEAGMYGPAAAVLGGLLEQVLRRVMGLHDDEPTGRKAPTLGMLAKRAQEQGGLPGVADDELRRAIEIRNRAVHGVADPSPDEALFMLNVVRKAAGQW